MIVDFHKKYQVWYSVAYEGYTFELFDTYNEALIFAQQKDKELDQELIDCGALEKEIYITQVG